MAETQSAPSLRELSERASPGEWHHCQPFMTVPAEHTVHGRVPAARVDYISTWPGLGTPPGHRIVVPMEGRESTMSSHDMAFVARLVSDFRADRLIDPTTLTEAVAAARAEGVREGLERAADICRLWDGPEIIPAVKAVLSDVELDIARRTAGGIADAICALITALPAPARAEGWQPIETAPKDETEVDLWVLDRSSGHDWRQPAAWWDGDEGWVAMDDGGDIRKIELEGAQIATHWRFPPAPPTTPGGRTDG